MGDRKHDQGTGQYSRKPHDGQSNVIRLLPDRIDQYKKSKTDVCDGSMFREQLTGNAEQKNNG